STQALGCSAFIAQRWFHMEINFVVRVDVNRRGRRLGKHLLPPLHHQLRGKLLVGPAVDVQWSL
ncbi:MAG: hypothetical protein EBU08_10525, partial [Micrococcales bacterium]|nr:hypothetical protein [Micrococcales bacterium]